MVVVVFDSGTQGAFVLTSCHMCASTQSDRTMLAPIRGFLVVLIVAVDTQGAWQ